MTMPNEDEGKHIGRAFQPAEREQDRALWDLLGRARRPAPPSPYFSRRVLREVGLWEEEETAKRSRHADGWWQRLVVNPAELFRPRAALAWGASAVAGAMALTWLFAPGSWQQAPSPRDGSPAVAVAPFAQRGDDASPGDDFESDLGLIPESINDHDLAVIADLDELLETNENRAWLEDDTTS